MHTVYVYKNCSTCKNALKWLEQHKIPHTIKAIRETPPSKPELQIALRVYDGNLRALFNTSGNDYRELSLKDKLPEMSQDEALKLLTQNGNLVKRPFLIKGDQALVGFKEDLWKKSLC